MTAKRSVLFGLLGLALACVMLAVLTASANAASRTINVACGADLDNAVNGDSSTIGTRFVLQSGCTFTASASVVLKGGDELVCAQAPTFTVLAINERAGEPHAPDSAYNPTAYCTVQGASGVDNTIERQGTTYLEGLNIQGGDFNGSSDSGKGIKDGSASDASYAYGIVVRNNDAQGIGNCHGDYNRIEVTNTTQDASALGFTGAGVKCVEEAVVRHSYVHDNQGNGLWCDEGCTDTSKGVFHINFNYVVNNGKDGIRWEFDEPNVANPGEALIEHNEVHGNTRTGVQARDAANAMIRDNIFGGNVGPGVRASDSGRTDRFNLFNIDIVTNVMNGDEIKGCELPDSVVYCSGNTP